MPRVVARKAEGQAPAGVAKGQRAAPAKRAKRNGKQAKDAEPKPLGKAELERVGKVIAAHAALRTLGREIETRARIYPMHGTPAGLVKCPAVEIALPRELYEASRIARGPGPWKGAWKRVVLSKAEGVRKRAALKAAMARHRAALEDEADEEDVAEFDELPEARKAAYFERDDSDDDEEGPGAPVLESSHKNMCTTPAVSHALLALAPGGLRIGMIVTAHGREDVFASISKLQLVYDCKAETLRASAELNFQQAKPQ